MIHSIGLQVSAPPEAAMPYDKQGGESGQKPEAMTNGGAVTPQMTMLTASEPVRQISQKPVVKPNVLTHVIEGYIIQEGPEPFPVRTHPRVLLFLKFLYAGKCNDCETCVFGNG